MLFALFDLNGEWMPNLISTTRDEDSIMARETASPRVRIAGMGDNVIDFNVSLQRKFPGGNSINVSILARQMGCESSFLGVIGRDDEGGLIRKTLFDAGVDTRYLIERPGETGKCRIELINGDRVITDINDFGVVRTDPFVITDDIIAYLRRFDLVHSGCYGCMIPELPKLNQAGISVLFDYSDKWSEDKLFEAATFADFVLFSGKDWDEDDLTTLLREIVGRGRCGFAVTTIGKRGAILYDGNDIYRTRSFGENQDIVDSTAAGDAFITGFIVTLLTGRKLFKRFECNPAIQKDWKISPSFAGDYEVSLIRHAIHVGNIMALYTCMHEGSFGQGQPM